jgi:ADP-heptose:LPS heptosyltransferase/GT2 family glycosyltransferase
MTPNGFRPGEDLAPDELPAIEPTPPQPAAEPAGLGFTKAADTGGTDLDVLMGYQIILGRDPENSFVIADAKSSPVGAFIRAFVSSGEFQSSVQDRLESGRPLPHETASIAPSRQQLDWLFRFITVPSYAETMLRSAPTWRDFLRVFLAVPGVPLPPARTAAAKPDEPKLPSTEADEGFVLVNLEQPKPNDKLQAGALVTGSGWIIAPADITEVAVLLDQHLLTHARYGLPRPDVARSFPHYRHVDHCGFAFTAEIPADAVITQASQLIVRARTVRGEEGLKTMRVQPPSQAAPGTATPGAEDAWPMRLSVDEAVVDEGRVLRVRGWIAARAGLQAVVAHLGETRLPEIRTGLARPDIAKTFPDYANAANAGFALVHELDEEIAAGPAFVRVQAKDARGATRQTILPVTVPPAFWLATGEPGAETLPPGLKPREALETYTPLPPQWEDAEPARGSPEIRLEIDTPVIEAGAARETLRGALTISGWAVARAGVDGIDIFCDGRELGRAYLGMRREDIGTAFSDFPDSLFAGYALVLPPGSLPAGRRALTVRVTAKKQGKAPPATTETTFLLQVAEFDSLPPGGALRLRLPHAESSLGLARLAQQNLRTAFEIVVSLGSASKESLAALGATLGSLKAQAYPDWTATVFLPDAALAKTKSSPQAADAQGRIAFAGVKEKRKAAAKAHFLVKLRAGDRLGADALLELALRAAADRTASFIYSDEIRLDPAQARRQAFFKPDWSPNLLLAMNYVGRLWCAKSSLAEAAGLPPQALAAASDYDAVLRLTEQVELLPGSLDPDRCQTPSPAKREREGARREAVGRVRALGQESQPEQPGSIVHVPRVLCERGEAGDTPAEEKAALESAMTRRGISGTAEAGPVDGTWRIRRTLAKPKFSGKGVVPGMVSIIIPTCSARGLIRAAIASIRATTAPARKGGVQVEIIAADNTPAKDKSARAWLRKNADTVVPMEGPFNWSRFNNAGAAIARGEYLLFLNDDIEITQPGWLEALLEHAQNPANGVIGAKLLYPDGKIQHAGQYLADFHARHAFRFAEGKSPGPFGLAAVAREMIAVTGACQLMHRRVFDRLGGFEEAHSVVNNDLDFCLRAWQAGLAVIYTPHAELVHHELASRAQLDDIYDEARFRSAWRDRFLLGDPFRNPHLAKDSDHYGAEQEPSELLYAGRRGPMVAEVKRILAVKLDHIGDFLTAIPALHALRTHFPQASIDLLVPSASAALAAPGGVPEASVPVDNVLIFDFFHARSAEGQRSLADAEFAALHARLAPKKYDLAIDLRMHPETRIVLRHTGAAWLAGYDHANRYPWLDIALEWEGDIRLVRKRAHITERLVQLVAAAAAACHDPAPTAAAKSAPSKIPPALAALPAKFLARPLVCIHPGVGNVVRQWPAASYAALIDLLAGRQNVHVVLIGAKEEAPIAETIMRGVTHQGVVESLVGRVKLAELPEVMRACVLFVGNNSGPQHIAASLGLPTIGIHSGVVDAAEWAPLGPQALAMRRAMVCSPCYLEFASDCPRALACLTGLPPRDVFAACLRFLGRR